MINLADVTCVCVIKDKSEFSFEILTQGKENGRLILTASAKVASWINICK